MTGWLYKQTEAQIWTVGHYTPDGAWEPESDHVSPEEAAARVHYLNGGSLAFSIIRSPLPFPTTQPESEDK